MDARHIYVNAQEPVEFENDFFNGRMLFLVRTNPPDPKVTTTSRVLKMQAWGCVCVDAAFSNIYGVESVH